MRPRYVSMLYLTEVCCIKSFSQELSCLQEKLIDSMQNIQYKKCIILNEETGELMYQINNYA